MSNMTLDDRVTALEQTVAELMEKVLLPPAAKDWRSTIGVFAGNALMKEIDEEGRKIREADREQTRCDHS